MENKDLILDTINNLNIRKSRVQIVFKSGKIAETFWEELSVIEEECSYSCYDNIYDAILAGEASYWGTFSTNDTVREVLLNYVDNIVKLTTLWNIHEVSSPAYNYFENKCKELPTGNYCITFENDCFQISKYK